jgi:hypothetical protein
VIRPLEISQPAAHAALAPKSAGTLRFCMPVVVLWLLLLPAAPLLVLAVLILCATNGVSPVRAMAESFRLIAALRETYVEVQSREVSIVVGSL